MINKMNLDREQAIKLIENTKSVPALTRSFIFWLYRNGYKIADTQTATRKGESTEQYNKGFAEYDDKHRILI